MDHTLDPMPLQIIAPNFLKNLTDGACGSIKPWDVSHSG